MPGLPALVGWVSAAPPTRISVGGAALTHPTSHVGQVLTCRDLLERTDGRSSRQVMPGLPALVGWVSAAPPTRISVGGAALTHPTRTPAQAWPSRASQRS